MSSIYRLRPVLLVLPLLVLSACAESMGPAPEAETTPTWDVIQARIITPNCATACHVAGSSFATQSDLVLTPDVAYDQLVGQPPHNPAAQADGLLRVGTEGLPSLYKSYLWEKINAPDQEHFYVDHADYGAIMPLGKDALTNGELEMIRQWIIAGAPRDVQVERAPVSLLDDTTRFAYETFTPPPAPANGIQFHLGPFEVAPGVDREFLYYDPLNYEEDVFINRFEVVMRPGSHHFLWYLFDDEIQTLPAPYTYRDFRDERGQTQFINLLATQYHIFFAGTQTPRTDYRFPPGVALRLPGGQGLDLNSHYVNRGPTPRTGEVYANLHFAEADEIEKVAEVMFLSNFDIHLPPKQVTTLTKTFDFDVRTHVFHLWSHAHETMTEFKVEVAGGPRDGELVYISYDWEHPPLLQIDPPLTLEAGQGLKLTTTYDNYTDRTLRFGLLSQDEMMILFGYAYTD